MKAIFHKLSNPEEQSFDIRKYVNDYFDEKWHFHDMLQLVYIQKGKGTKYIGDSIESFSDGDVILLGSKLPHAFKSDFSEIQRRSKKKCVSIIIQFPISFLGEYFLQLPESKSIKNLFSLAERGVIFTKDTKILMSETIISLLKYDGMERLVK